MPFLLSCTNKGCGKQNESVLDIDTNEVYCIECNKVMQNISSFTKTQMKSLGQTKKIGKQPYAMKCTGCKKEGTPKIVDNKVLCNFCSTPIVISKPFEVLLRTHLKNKDIDE